jgi:RNA polymerase subunit RPABC4/transcription elongation factor Spt4
MPPALDLTILDDLLLFLTAFFGAFLAALWLSFIFWAWRDIRARSKDRILWMIAVLVTALFGPAGLAIYLILRPARTLDEQYQQTLEEEALLSRVEERASCPGCARLVDRDWQLCPTCHTRLRKACRNCGKLLELPWKLCPFCATSAPIVSSEVAQTEAPALDGA